MVTFPKKKPARKCSKTSKTVKMSRSRLVLLTASKGRHFRHTKKKPARRCSNTSKRSTSEPHERSQFEKLCLL